MRISLKNSRLNNNLTQLQVSNFLKISERQYQHLEAGTRGTSAENWIKLYYLFNEKTPLNKLMENTKERSLNFGEENDFSKNINKIKDTTGGV